MTKEKLDKIARRYAQDELKDNHGQVEDIVAAAFLNGIDYAENHPHWISVEDELPPIGWTMSDSVLVTDGKVMKIAWYHQDEGWLFATGLKFEPTHWMPLPSIETIINKQL